MQNQIAEAILDETNCLRHRIEQLFRAPSDLRTPPTLVGGTPCATIGTTIDLKEGIDIDPHALDGGGGIAESKLPRVSINGGCTAVYPHNMLRVNTIFEVVRAAGMYTAYSEKRPAYDFLNGPSGTGVQDLYTPEIAFDNPAANDTLKSVTKTEAFDQLRVVSILNEINGLNHDGTQLAPVPALFGM